MLNSFDDAQAESAHTVQYYEFAGNRGIYKDGWYTASRTSCPGRPSRGVPSPRTDGSCTTRPKTSAAPTIWPRRNRRSSGSAGRVPG